MACLGRVSALSESPVPPPSGHHSNDYCVCIPREVPVMVVGGDGDGPPRQRAPRRRGFFTWPAQAAHRRYEALRAYFVEGISAREAAARFGYATSTMVALVRDFEPVTESFFAEQRPGPRFAPAKEAARDQAVRLRRAGYSVAEISQALAERARRRPTAPGCGRFCARRASSAWRPTAPRAARGTHRGRPPSAAAPTRPGPGAPARACPMRYRRRATSIQPGCSPSRDRCS